MKYFLAFLCVFSCLNGIFAGTMDPSTPDKKYIDYGSKFSCVCIVEGAEKDGTLFFASAVIISEHYIVTAAHIVHKASLCYIVVNQTQKYDVDQIICHKNFANNDFGSDDIALLHVNKKIEIPFYPPLYEQDDEVGKVCAISGYGLIGTFKEGAKIGDGKRRAGSNIIERIEGKLLICNPSFNHKKTELEFLIASGDSGGGLFIDGKLAGINSCVFAEQNKKPVSDYFTESGHTRVSRYVEWIKENTK